MIGKTNVLFKLLSFIAISAVLLSSCTGRTVLDGLTGADTGDQLHVWFVKPAGQELKLIKVSRSRGHGEWLKEAVEELLRGPSGQEIQAGMGSEIPRGTILLGVVDSGDSIELNLSRRFASGGGSSSLELRLEQLRRTVSEAAAGKKVYLNVEGQRLTTAAGEGLEIKQPIN
jgi:spore germination protein GerM